MSSASAWARMPPRCTNGIFQHAPKGSLAIVSVRTQSDPTISSITTAIMITTSNSPAQGSVVPNHYAGDLTLAGNITDLPSFATGRKFLT